MDASIEIECREIINRFFEKYPNDFARAYVMDILQKIISHDEKISGKSEYWAVGIIDAVMNKGCGVPNVSNKDLELFFGTSIGTIRTYSNKIRNLPYLYAEDFAVTVGMTVRDEANSLCAYAFRNGFLETIHEQNRITDDEMKILMISASEKMAELLTMKNETPAQYELFIRKYNMKYCSKWDR